MKFTQFILLLAFLITFWQCRPENYSPKSYTEFLKDDKNGLKKQVTAGPVLFELTYIPAELLTFQKLAAGDITRQEFEKAVIEASEFAHFELCIKSAVQGESVTNAFKRISGEDVTKGEDLNNLIAFGLQNKLALISSLDSLPPAICQYIPTGSVNNAYNIILGFEKNTGFTSLQADRSFSIQIAPSLFNPEPVRFIFKENDIKQLPKLTF